MNKDEAIEYENRQFFIADVLFVQRDSNTVPRMLRIWRLVSVHNSKSLNQKLLHSDSFNRIHIIHLLTQSIQRPTIQYTNVTTD